MSLSVRQRRILADMGIPVWRSRFAAAPAVPEQPEPAVRAAAAAAGAPAPAVTEEPVQAPPVQEQPMPEPSAVADADSKPAVPSPAALDWPQLEARVRDCAACAELAGGRTQTVFGVGDRNARWLFVGEAPGAEEDRRGEPFVGRAGKLLDNMLAALGLDRRRDVFIANVLKCRPPGNRDPKPEEALACRGYLDRQIALIEPQVIVALGRVAAQSLLGTERKLGALRDEVHDYHGVPLVVTYHPAYLLRAPADKARAWQDLRRARACVQS